MPLAYPIDARGTYGFNWWVNDGTRKTWHPMVLTFRGPRAAEMDTAPNRVPCDRLQVAFTGPAGRTYHVPSTFDGARQR